MAGTALEGLRGGESKCEAIFDWPVWSDLMGNEATCTVRFGKQKSKGKALLETSEVLFRGDFRLKIPFSSIKSAKSAGGELRVQTPEGLAVFELGDTAAKWRDKILHPSQAWSKGFFAGQFR
jgi:hypothetical protein